MEPMTRAEWQALQAALRAPFEPTDVHFRLQGTAKPIQGKLRGQVVAYIDARAVQDRLDAVVGSENWSFAWQPIAVVNGVVKVAKGSLSLFALPPKEDVGDSGDIEPSKSAVSDALKRAAVQWGIGRYLYELPSEWVEVEALGEKAWRIPVAVIQRLRASLPRPVGASATASAAARSPTQATRESHPAVPPAPPPRPQAEASAPLAPADGEAGASATAQLANEQQLQSIRKLCVALSREEPAPESLTSAAAGTLIRQLSRDYNARRPGQTPQRDLTPPAAQQAR